MAHSLDFSVPLRRSLGKNGLMLGLPEPHLRSGCIQQATEGEIFVGIKDAGSI
jgi:hypothetical protein